MTRHQLRADRPAAPISPPRDGAQRPVSRGVISQHLLHAGTLLRSPRLRAAVWVASLVAGILGQVVLLLATSYLIDLSVSLMELWAELARKHLELTL